MDQFSPLLRFDRDGPGPAYKRLARTVAEAIHAGELASGAPLPTERWLSQALGLSRVTVRAAYRSLVEDGLLDTRAGSGNYVRAGQPPFEQPLWRLSSFSDDMAARGRKAASRLVELTRVEASAAEAAALSLGEGSRIVRLTRLRLADDVPLGLEVASLPEDLVGQAALGDGSLYAALAARDLSPARGLQRMRAVSLEPGIAALLGAAPGDAAMLIERMSFLRDGRPIEYTKSHYRGDAYDFVAPPRQRRLEMTQTHMLREAGEAAAAIRRLLGAEDEAIAEAARLVGAAGGPLTTAARGSSDHAVTAFKYACEIVLGLPVASIGPSVASVYDAPLRLEGGVHLTVSQSGASPDIVALQAAAARGGARSVAIVNVADSPLARAADLVLPIHAGEETSVAATKSFLASCAALLAIVARAAGDGRLLSGLAALPDALDALRPDAADGLVDDLAAARSLYVAGRGPAFGIALEAALKAKETAGIHAEAFSAAELMHGPLQLIQPGFPVAVFVADDASRDGTLEAMARLRRLGGRVLAISTLDLDDAADSTVRTPATGHAATDALVFALAWYRAIEAATRRRGLDPDRPANLRKVTETV